MNRILVPTDLSEISENALRFACEIADKAKAEIYLINFLKHPFDESFTTTGDVSAKYDDEETIFTIELIRRNTRLLEEMANDYGANRTIYYQVHNRDLDGVDEYVREKNIDLVVMGTSGEENAREFFTGNHTEQVIIQASCPVISLQEGQKARNLDKIVLGVELEEDDKDNFRNATNYLRDIVDTLGAKLHLVHVSKKGSSDKEEEELLLKQFAEKFNLDNYTISVQHANDLEKGIMYYAHSIGAGMVAVLTHSEGGFFRIFTTSLSEELSKDSDIPVLTINLHRV